MLVPLLIAAVVGYLLGSLPFGYVVACAKGVNIFEVGSKSPGATNVRRTVGKGPGNLVFLLDMLKGIAAAAWPILFFVAYRLEAQVFSLFLAVVGHSCSCFTKFRGGKGVATTAGGFLVLMPFEAAVGAVVWIVLFFSLRYVSLASIAAAIALPVAAFFFDEPQLLKGLAVVIAAFVIMRHRANIGRLLNGTENKFARKSETPARPGDTSPDKPR
ncbi:MAG: glycerol-3-phosphate 1-O-acyltransferase PlsY [Verrucomicrobiota bacterium]|nr:glycerol-3-phosphate 1-O-acyltransferase PlsY [Verrucomicrobiota bacterium]